MTRTPLLRLLAAGGAVFLGVCVPGAVAEASIAQIEPADLASDQPVVEVPPIAAPPEATPEPPLPPPPPPPPPPVVEEPPVETPAPPPVPVDVPPPVEIPDVPAPPEPPAPLESAPEPAPSASPSAAPAQAPAAPEDPPGNNGTIKVDEVEFDSHPNNEPHVGCTFQIDFYGYDQGDLSASVLFEGIPPTGGGELLTDTVFIGGDAAGGGTDLDASRTYDLSEALADVPPHPVQGHHVKLTIEAQGSQGSPVKHKVFWVEGCCPPTTPPTTTPPTTTPPTTTPPTTTPPTTTPPTTTPPTTTPPTSTPPTTAPPTTAPPTTAPPATPPPAIAGPVHFDEQPSLQPADVADVEVTAGDLPRTGSEVGTMVAAGVVLVTLGALAVVLGRRLRVP